MESHTKHYALLGAAAATAGIVAAPYLIPALGIGRSDITDQILGFCGNPASGAGLAASLNSGLTSIPGIGSYLAAGTWSSAIISGGLGIGGLLLGNYLHKHYDKPGHIQWGKIFKYATLTTSLLVALPSLLTGITMGLTFLAFSLTDPTTATNTYLSLKNSLGLIGNMNTLLAGAGLGTLMPHFLSCGAAAAPAVGSLLFSGSGSKPSHQSVSSTSSWADRISAHSAIPTEISR